MQKNMNKIILSTAICLMVFAACFCSVAFAMNFSEDLESARNENIQMQQNLFNENVDSGLCTESNDHPYRETDVSSSSAGCALCYVDGELGSVGKSTLLKKINAIRKEAYDNRSIDPTDTSKRLRPEDYKPLDWSYEMEWIAQTRACEATINQGHTRTNGLSCFTCTHNGYSSNGESLAWNSSGMMMAIDQWYSEKSDWDKQTPGAVTGHYTAMISPMFYYVGMGNFVNPYFGTAFNCTSAEFYAGSGKMDTSETKEKGKYKQIFELYQGYAIVHAHSGASSIDVGQSYQYSMYEQITYGSAIYKYEVYTKDCMWMSSSSNVASVDSGGLVKGLKAGTTNIKAVCQNTFELKWTVTVKGSTRPVPKIVSTGDGSVKISWDKIDGATKYAVAERENGNYINFTTFLTNTEYEITNLANGYTHLILVQAWVNGSWSKFDEGNFLRVTPSGPTVKPTIGNISSTSNTISVDWNKVPGAKRYAINWKTSKSGWNSTFINANTLNYTIKNLNDDTAYSVLIQADIYGWTSFKDTDIKSVQTKKVRPNPQLVEYSDGFVTIKWDAIDGATKYAIAERENGKYINYDVDYHDTQITIENLANNYGHWILVQAYVNGKWSKFDDSNLKLYKPTGKTVKPEITKIEGGTRSINLSWCMVPGAKSYAVNYREVGTSRWFCEVVDAKTLSYTIKSLSSGKNYEVVVQSNMYGSWTKFTSTDIKNAHVK